MKLIHEYDQHGGCGHRVVLIRPGNLPREEGEWVSYMSIAELYVVNRRFIAVTAYHGLWNNAVVEVVTPDIRQGVKS